MTDPSLQASEQQSHLSFSIQRSSLRNRVLIPKYYDPEIAEATEAAKAHFDLYPLSDLLLPGSAGSRLGSWIRREFYGTGTIPFVRTSDLNDWRIRPDYKKGVSQDVFEQVASKQDVKAGDILMVAHGTYLVGTVAIVTQTDLPLVLQDHVFRLRINPLKKVGEDAEFDAWLLLACLSTQFVRRQIRARQFSADIIDKIGERHLDVMVPIPRDAKVRETVSTAVRAAIEAQTVARTSIRTILSSDLRMTRERAAARHGFSVLRSSLQSRIVIPKYYDPALKEALAEAEKASERPWIKVGDLVRSGLISLTTGVEVGKMAYGTGTIPFIRTTDIAELEVKADPRQGISEEIHKKYATKASVLEGDVILIRDGTYLVGSSALVTSADVPSIICGGIYRIRSKDAVRVPPIVLLGLLNLPLVRWQMRARQFTRDVIDTIGHRVSDVLIPHPDSDLAKSIGEKLGPQMKAKAALRKSITDTLRLIEPSVPPRLRNRPGWSMRG